MNATRKPAHALVAGDVMNCDPVVVPRQMTVREAVRLLHRARAGAAAVVDENGRYIGVLSPAEVYRWVEAGCPKAAVGPPPTCPYQVCGRLPGGEVVVICTLADGSCPFQAAQPTSGGRHTDLCLRPGTERPPLATVPPYMTTDVVPVEPQAPLPEVVRQLIDARAGRLVVLDEFGRPVGLVSATDVLNAVADGKGPDDKEY